MLDKLSLLLKMKELARQAKQLHESSSPAQVPQTDAQKAAQSGNLTG